MQHCWGQGLYLLTRASASGAESKLKTLGASAPLGSEACKPACVMTKAGAASLQDEAQRLFRQPCWQR